ncbi:MAG TPA: hypothetical protein VFO29_01695 [Candidatus Rubrimentiphilum sp.]|nr:hypothetical protein [Candidatus Rubrimentiphilum sp.]
MGFRDDVDATIANEVTMFLRTVPYASHLTGEGRLNEAYYLRHRIETIKRIRLTARLDALALAQFIVMDYEAARTWARYACTELDHDRLFLADLQAHGVTAKMVADTQPFPSTLRMISALEREIETTGPTATIAYSLFVEWNSERYSALVTDKVESQFSRDHVRGSRAHLKIDDGEDHYNMILTLAAGLGRRFGNEQILQYLREIGAFFRTYFEELYEQTSAKAVS